MKTKYILLTLCLCLLYPWDAYSSGDNDTPSKSVTTDNPSAPAADLFTISNSEFFSPVPAANPFGWLKGIKGPKDLLQMIRVGVHAKGEVLFPISTDTSLKEFGYTKPQTKFNFKLDIGLPIATLTFAYNINSTTWGGESFAGRYFLTHINFYNLHALAGIDGMALWYFPTGTYAWGNTSKMSYRELDLRILVGMGYNETAYVFHDFDNPYLTTYYARRKISMVGIKGLIEAAADYDLWNLAYGQEPSGLNYVLANSLGPFALFLPIPYAGLYLIDTKKENRFYDIPVNSSRTGYNFGWDFGLLYAHSFYKDLGPGRLIVQPRINFVIMDTSMPMSSFTVEGDYLPIVTGLKASLDICYFF